MRREYVDYEYRLPIKMDLLNIRNYPTVWQDSTRIFFVLEGSLEVTIGNEDFKLEEREIEIVNIGEIYSLASKEDNLVLVLDISPDFFRQYVDDVDKIYYYTDTLDLSKQWDPKYRILREYLSILYYEYLHRGEAYETRIESSLLKMMYHLLNNFHHLYYEEESLREDEIQFERFNRIINYLRENYNTRVSLGEIAEKEYLTSQYLSYKIKATFGQSFNDFLNRIRVEESRKLLLTTDKSISEIAQETGFSHSRYYNKHFKKLYGLGPAQYREAFSLGQEELEAEKEVEVYNLEEGMDYLRDYLADYGDYGRESRILKRRLNLEDPIVGTRPELNSIFLEDISLILDRESRARLEEARDELGIENCVLEASYLKGILSHSSLENESRLRASLDSFRELGLRPMIRGTSREARELGDILFKKGLLEEGELESYRYNLKNSSPIVTTSLARGLEANGRIIGDNILKGQMILSSLEDRGDSQSDPIFYRGQGLFTSSGLKKPNYYCLYILNKMARELVHLEEGLIMTRSKDSFQILVYDPRGQAEISKDTRISLNILGLRQAYSMASYRLNRDYGSIYNSWEKLDESTSLEPEYIGDLNKLIVPRLDYSLVPRTNVYNIVHDLEDSELVLYDFKKI